MSEIRIEDGDDPLAAERARLREAARALEAERERLRAAYDAAPGDGGAGREDERARAAGSRGERGRGRRRGMRFGLPMMMVDPELTDWWERNGPLGLVGRFLRDVPDEFVDHLRAARREHLLAARTFVDYALEQNERRGAPEEGRRARAVPIDEL